MRGHRDTGDYMAQERLCVTKEAMRHKKGYVTQYGYDTREGM